MAHLEIETREGTRKVALERDRLSIGRLAYNDVVLPFGQISRQHAELRHINGQWWIADLHSTNGLHLDARRIQEHALRDGDVITLAPGIVLRYVGDGATQLPANGTAAGQRAPSPRPPTDPFVPRDSVPPMRPRSVFANDEAPFVPPGMAQMPGSGRDSSIPPSPSGRQSQSPGARTPGFPPSAASQGTPTLGPAMDDPYRRSGPVVPRPNVPSAPASMQLHVCQTCGRLTAADAIFCQSCHQSIARECPICRLSLLPVQERCPRCHTPNEAYVGRQQNGRQL